MIVIGISFSHNGSVCILEDGKIIAAIQAERLTRVKRQSLDLYKNVNALILCLNYCLLVSKLSVKDIDIVAFSSPWKISGAHSALDKFFKRISPDKEIKVKSISHHLAHAEYIIHYGKGMSGPVCVIDGSGSFGAELTDNDFHDITGDDNKENSKRIDQTKETVSIYNFKEKKLKTKFKILSSKTKEINYGDYTKSHRHSVGHLWEVASRIIFKNPNQAGKVMGLIGYNKKSIDQTFLSFAKDGRPLLETDAINEEIIKINENNFSILDLSYIADIVQNDTNNYVINLLKSLVRKDDEAIYLSGGVMLNIKLNTEISKNFPDKKIIVNGSTEDNGTAIGAACCAYRELSKENIFEKPNDYYGKEYTSNEVISSLEKENLKYKKLKDDELAAFIAKKITESKVIMLSNGRSEFGPRALGHRSILANALDPSTKRKLDSEIKLREPFRPYAPLVLDDYRKEYFDLKSASPFMLFDAKVLSDKLPAITHVDGTSRPQTVSKENGIIYKILKEIMKLTGIPVCLNTSLNRPGEPICESPKDAIDYAINSQADYLVLENFLVEL